MQQTRSDRAPLSHTNRGYLLALASAAILATTSILIRYLTQTFHLPALVLAMWREAFTSLSLLLVLAIFARKLIQAPRAHLPYLLAWGFVLSLFNSTWTLSVAINGAAVSTVLAYSSAGFTALLGWWLLKEDLTWVKGVAVILSLAGCVLVAGALDASAWRVNPVGILTGIASGLLYAVYTLMGRSASQRGLNPWTTVLYTFGIASLFMLTYNLLGRGFLPGAITAPADFFWLGKSVAGWGILFLLAAGPTLVGFGLYNMSLADLPSSVVNLIATSEPVFTAAIAYFLLAERYTAVQVLGSAFILAGVVFLRMVEGRAEALRVGSLPVSRT
jgi:drug/metabolite transporter (DMT)-like permease